ncbi:MAG: hypothetical protein ACM3H8_15215 [Sphingobacteriales bacterium]
MAAIGYLFGGMILWVSIIGIPWECNISN